MFELPMDILDNPLLINILCDIRSAILNTRREGVGACHIFPSPEEMSIVDERVLGEFSSALSAELEERVQVKRSQDFNGIIHYWEIEVS